MVKEICKWNLNDVFRQLKCRCTMHSIYLSCKLVTGKDLENCTSDTPLEVCQARDETACAMKIVSEDKFLGKIQQRSPIKPFVSFSNKITHNKKDHTTVSC